MQLRILRNEIMHCFEQFLNTFWRITRVNLQVLFWEVSNSHSKVWDITVSSEECPMTTQNCGLFNLLQKNKQTTFLVTVMCLTTYDVTCA